MAAVTGYKSDFFAVARGIIRVTIDFSNAGAYSRRRRAAESI